MGHPVKQRVWTAATPAPLCKGGSPPFARNFVSHCLKRPGWEGVLPQRFPISLGRVPPRFS